MSVLTDVLSAKARKLVYLVYALIGLALGSTQVGYTSAQMDQPVWLVVSMSVFGFVGTALGLTAAANVNKDPMVVDIPDGEGAHRAEV